MPKHWTDREIDALQSHYPSSPISDLRAALPRRALTSIKAKGIEIGLHRSRAWADVTQAHEIFQRLRKRRIELGLTGRDLAKRIGIHESGLNHYECGRIAPSWFIFCAWIEALGMEIDLRLTWNERMKGPMMRRRS